MWYRRGKNQSICASTASWLSYNTLQEEEVGGIIGGVIAQRLCFSTTGLLEPRFVRALRPPVIKATFFCNFPLPRCFSSSDFGRSFILCSRPVVDLDAEAAEVSFLWACEDKFEFRPFFMIDFLQVPFVQADAERAENFRKIAKCG